MYARKVLCNPLLRQNETVRLDGLDVDVGLKDWFRFIVEELSLKYEKSLNQKTVNNIVELMIKDELFLEKHSLKVNKKLANTLREIKSESRVDIYYISDIYLNKDELGQLLDYFDLSGIFSGGISSIEALATKRTGKLFNHIEQHQVFGQDFSWHHNTHIGDNPSSDIKMPANVGSKTYRVKPSIYQALRPVLGPILAARMYVPSVKQRRLYNAGIKELPSTSQRVGFIFAQPLSAFLQYITYLIPHSSYKFLFVSSEAKIFEKFLPSWVLRRGNVEMCHNVNRRLAFRACAYKVVLDGSRSKFDNFLEILGASELGSTQKRLCDFFGISSTDPMADGHFNDYLFSTLARQKSMTLESFCKSYETIERLLESDEICIVDVGWNNSAPTALFYDDQQCR